MRPRQTLFPFVLGLLLLSAGCSTLLPSAKAITESPWHTYADAKGSFDRIEVGKTTEAELKTLGFDTQASPNLKILSYLDVAATVQSIPIQELDPGLQACLRARAACRAYVFEPNRIFSVRKGNFWLDILNFRRKTQETGWRFKALIVFVNSHVAYKLSSGEPQIDHLQDQRNPLGPLQDPANFFFRYIP